MRLPSTLLFSASWYYTSGFSPSCRHQRRIDSSNESLFSHVEEIEAITGSTYGLTKDKITNLQTKAEQLAFDNHDNYAMNALFVNVEEKPDPIPCTVCDNGLPNDLPPGCLLRIGPNGATVDEGFLDGDGLIHAITIPPKDYSNGDGASKTPMYSCTYVETNGRELEKKANAAKADNGNNGIRFKGTLGAAPFGWPMLQSLVQNGIEFNTLSCQKDTCNTAMAISGNRILALMEQCPPSEIQVHKDGRISTVNSMLNLDGAVQAAPITGGSFGAHGRTDPETGERIHVSYNSNDRPFVKVDAFDENWKLVSSKGVDIPAPVMVHDSAMSSKYVVICDFPLTVRPRRFLQNQFPVEYEPKHGARIGLVPRDMVGDLDMDRTRWFDVEPGVTLHLVNAYDTEDGNIVIHGFKSTPKTDKSYILDYSSSYLHEWVIDLKRNEIISDQCLNANEIVEFPSIEDSKVTKKCNYTYGLKTTSIGSPMFQFKTPATGVLLDGVVKFSLDNDEEKRIMAGDVIGRYMLPKGWHFVSEPTVVEKLGNKKGHYVLLVATEVPEEGRCTDHVKFALDGKTSLRSQMVILDGDNISRGPVASIDVPAHTHINYGLHSLFVSWDLMISQKAK